jgi:hypothetical protein
MRVQILAPGVASTVGGACVGRVRVGPANARVAKSVIAMKVFIPMILTGCIAFVRVGEDVMF